LKRIEFWSGKLYRRAVQEIASRVYINPEADPRKSILVAGAARSGTTWLEDLIASQIPCRILFEPFNPDLVPEYRRFHYFQYMRPATENPEFGAFARRVFTGEIRNRWIDRQNERIHSQYRLIKEIRINLALKWLHDNFPEIPIILLIRHPCAVVASRMELGWATDRDIEPFLSQPDLIADHLGPYLNLIKNAETIEEKHAIIWSVSNLVPLKQLQSNEVVIVYYENLCTQPEIQLPTVFTSIGKNYAALNKDAIKRPSQTTRASSAVANGTDQISSWQKKLSVKQITNILRIVQMFGLDHIYDDSLLPLSKNAI
jgi:sulfotransferase family protein